jgi:hypothetical protein
MRKRTTIILAGVSVLAGAMSWAQSPNMRMETIQRPVEVRPLSPEITQRYDNLQKHLKPSAKSWVDQQAKIEAQRNQPDMATLEEQVRQRFAASLDKKSKDPAGDISSIMFLVMAQATQDADQDLKEMMSQMQATSDSKKKLREEQDQLKQDLAATHDKMTKECHTSACKTLPAELKQLSVATAASPHPVRLVAPQKLTYGDVQQMISQIQNEKDSLDEMSEQEQLKLQMYMDRRSKAEAALSNLMKKMNDTHMSIIQNLK